MSESNGCRLGRVSIVRIVGTGARLLKRELTAKPRLDSFLYSALDRLTDNLLSSSKTRSEYLCSERIKSVR